ncbi:phosphatidylserine decarboxylase proenzyme, mitochondrial [Lepeophtheirus salmonis]|nr:phosphatidylserine decarboxylase proenzyme, mitochondrial-like [Lepeophtheirus salmonis]
MRKIGGILGGLGTYFMWQHYNEKEPGTFRGFSRAMGRIADAEIPIWAREPIFKTYSRFYNCNLDEVKSELQEFSSFSNFFRRELKEGTRPVCPESPLVSPCDGKVLHVAKYMDSGFSVKGISFSIKSFLGIQTVPKTVYICTIYLSPGDYHRFHSPANWNIKSRTHFSGYLLSVNPFLLKFIKNLFCLNERVIYMGDWTYGFFSMTPVGATNVGSIRVGIDPELTTNQTAHKIGAVNKKDFEEIHSVVKGELFGEFNLGSTIVLLFEGPSNLELCIHEGDTVKTGQPILHKNFC